MNSAKLEKLEVRASCPDCGSARSVAFSSPTGGAHFVCSDCSTAFTVDDEASGDLVVSSSRQLGRFVSL